MEGSLLSSQRNEVAFTSRHDAVSIAQPKEVLASLAQTMEDVAKEVRADLQSAERLAAFHENKKRLTVIHVAVHLIDQNATNQTFTSLQGHNDSRFIEVVRWARTQIDGWLTRFKAQDN